MKPTSEHRELCTIELIARGHAERCPGAACAFWVSGCVLERVETELDDHPEVAALLLDLRQKLDAGRDIEVGDVRERFVELLDESGPASGATELV